jgi:hypothetical protein
LFLEEILKGCLSSFLRGFWGLDGLRWMAKPWDQSGCDLAFKTFSSCLGDDSFSSL